MASNNNSDSSSSVSRDAFTSFLLKLDKDLALQVVITAMSKDASKLTLMMTACSDVMYYRSMMDLMKKPIEDRDFSIYEIEDQLRKTGFIV